SNLDELEQACADKLAAAQKLQALGLQLGKLQAAPAQIETLLAQAPDAGASVARWRELLRLAAQCQQLNQDNGALLEQRQLQLRRTRSTLLGHRAAPATYGRSGDSGFDLGRRSLASA
ncbi:MAG TPA: flagellar export chaperone FlgN, partial [Nevskiaceae bacterium]|nr:flagellar export chaperone FlgN [Nevskiaceae bacterium]